MSFLGMTVDHAREYGASLATARHTLDAGFEAVLTASSPAR